MTFLSFSFNADPMKQLRETVDVALCEGANKELRGHLGVFLMSQKRKGEERTSSFLTVESKVFTIGQTSSLK